MIAYAVIEGEYSDWELVGITLDKDIADAMAKLHNGYVLESEVIDNKSLIQEADTLIYQYNVLVDMDFNNRVSRIRIDYPVYVRLKEKIWYFEEIKEVYKKYKTLKLSLFFKTEQTKERIEKIVYDKIAEYKASEKGINLFNNSHLRIIEKGDIYE